MSTVVYDSLRQVAEYDPFDDKYMESIDGFQILENKAGRYFVHYGGFEDDKDRQFILPPDVSADHFIATKAELTHFASQQRFLFDRLVEVQEELQSLGLSEETLQAACEAVYTKPQNYVGFVALNMVKSQFLAMAKERLISATAQIAN